MMELIQFLAQSVMALGMTTMCLAFLYAIVAIVQDLFS